MGAVFSKCLPGSKPLRLMIVGISGAGKTSTMMRVLQIMASTKNEKRGSGILVGTHSSSIGMNQGECKMFGKKCLLIELGGQEHFRDSWFNHLTGADAILFVMDGANMNTYEESREEFLRVAEDPALLSKPLLLFVNKSDVDDTFAGFETIVHDFGLENVPWLTTRQFRVMEGSALEGEGVFTLFRWLVGASQNKAKRPAVQQSIRSGSALLQ
ncbi:Small GTPase superfamily ARF/SAR type [Carpediemonas membranifera]|uniref:Small GTPase superfamily ARF/SAR type n=1 Tax=Carpediemonas membranifera TaxID=201153 RepID=A0A8J6E5Q9_9EUKA|nr:Small GTPase superfamily ARF/SAR type [Carpediemonas membranifera]|eukprot:KAG9396157.1 Small GTPase superfamily ARF/SAR type [Carpediemonas membranifera]